MEMIIINILTLMDIFSKEWRLENVLSKEET